MPIRSNPYSPVTWYTTEGTADAAPGDDDFAARTDDGYLLRVEQMDRRNWWWQVYTPDGEPVLENPWHMRTKADAFTIAETVYELHRRLTERYRPTPGWSSLG